MDKDKLLREIGSDLSILQGHIQRLRKQNQKIHPLDVDLMLENTRKIYEKLLSVKLDSDDLKRTIVLPETMPEAELPEVSMSSKTEEPEEAKAKPVVNKKEPVEKTSNVTVEENNDPVTQVKPKDKLPEKENEKEKAEKTEAIKKVIPDEKPEPVQEPEYEEPPKKASVSDDPEPPANDKNPDRDRTAFDLFTSNAETTIADKLGKKDDASIAEKIQQSQVADLRQAIGINEKFLFINELFNGDLGRYNKAIDEFNELKSQQGIDTHLLEMKIQNQWPEDGEAYIKLKALLDRKFG